ncbi:MAG TPA: methyltransferase domain-containing protein [Planctomycetota bacterium]|nr:methyltransferase domain-containing protein [Planctomycetota bacterium]
MTEEAVEWDRVAGDYLQYRAGPPPSYYARLKEQGVGLPGQRLLDLGTGTGVLARNFARAGARVTGVDASRGQIDQAVRAAADEKLPINFRVASAESMPFDAGSFDAVTANQCWHFFDSAKALGETRRVLVRGGALVVSDFFWVAARDPVAAATEDLILKYSPKWNGYRWSGELPARPDMSHEAVITYEEAVAFTRDTWRGRLRTCRAIGPALSPREVAAFDEDLRKLLEAKAPERFDVLHRIVAHVYRMA